MNFVGIIPARYASTRFPGKPLAKLNDKTVIQRVYEQVSKVINHVFVATDDLRIYNHVIEFGGKAVMTSSLHKSGTDRIAEALQKIGGDWDVVMNIQGDEPFIHCKQIETLCECFNDPNTQIATLGKPFENINEVENPNSPKIVLDKCGFAMYFSRSVIPYIRGIKKEEWNDHFSYLKHIGIYAYRVEVLNKISRLPQSSLEIAESLEQLRWLENGYRIKVGFTDIETIGIDVPEDIKRAEIYLAEHSETY